MKKTYRSLATLVIALAGSLATSSLAASGLSTGVAHSRPLVALGSSPVLANCEFGVNQVFDTQWTDQGTIPSENLSVAGMDYPYQSNPTNQRMTSAQLPSTDYFKFVWDSGTSNWQLVLFNSGGSQVQIVDKTGTFLFAGNGFIFYNGAGSWGTLITTQGSYHYGDSATFSVSVDNPSNTQMSNYNTCLTSPAPFVPKSPTGLKVTTSAPRLTASIVPFGNNSTALTAALQGQIKKFATTAVADGAAALVTWTAPAAATGTSAVTGYTVTATPGGATCASVTTSCVVQHLTGGTAYSFSVRASSKVGSSSPIVSAFTPYLNISLVGYASSPGSSNGNQKLGLGRAQSVATYLAAQLKTLKATGVRITSASSKGASGFVGNPASAANRRVVASLS